MIKIALQLQSNWSLHPFSLEDKEALKAYMPNQVLKATIQGVKHPRSYQQLKTYWGCCQVVADNNEKVGWQTKEQVDFQCRVALHFYDPDLVIARPDGSIAFNYRSISFDNLPHIEANNYFDRALQLMADFLKTTIEEMIAMIGLN